MTPATWLLVGKLVGAAALLGAATLGVRGLQEHYREQGRTEINAKWAEAKRLDEKARAEKERGERAKEQGMARKAEENARAQLKRDQGLQLGAAAVQRSADGLHGDIASVDGQSNARRNAGTCAAADAEAHEAATARALLGTCSDRYRAMAQDAAGNAAQVNDLQDHLVVVQPEAAALLEAEP